MRWSYRRRPSPGFVLLVTLTVALLLFFGWALRTPDLDRVWRMTAELELGNRPALRRHERRLLQSVMARFPEIGAELIEDRPHRIFSASDGDRVDGAYAYLVRQSADDFGLLEVAYAGARRDGSVSIRAQAGTSRHQGSASSGAPFTWQLPDDGPFPLLVEVLLEANEPGTKHRAPARVRLREAP